MLCLARIPLEVEVHTTAHLQLSHIRSKPIGPATVVGIMRLACSVALLSTAQAAFVRGPLAPNRPQTYSRHHAAAMVAAEMVL